MPLDEAIIYVTYEDDGRDTSGAQDSTTFPTKALLIFQNMVLAKEYEQGLKQFSNGRKNPRITGFYSQDSDEILVSCFPVRIIKNMSIK